MLLLLVFERKTSVAVCRMARMACRVRAGPARGPACMAVCTKSCTKARTSSGVRSATDLFFALKLLLLLLLLLRGDARLALVLLFWLLLREEDKPGNRSMACFVRGGCGYLGAMVALTPLCAGCRTRCCPPGAPNAVVQLPTLLLVGGVVVAVVAVRASIIIISIIAVIVVMAPVRPTEADRAAESDLRDQL